MPRLVCPLPRRTGQLWDVSAARRRVTPSGVWEAPSRYDTLLNKHIHTC